MYLKLEFLYSVFAGRFCSAKSYELRAEIGL